MRKKLLLLGGLGLVAVTALTCSPVFVLRAGYEEAKILSRRKPIASLVENSETPAEKREKLALVLQARNFADGALGLDAAESYTTYSWTDSDTLALVLSAAHRDRFKPVTWWFPIVGHVPYRGYFSVGSAERAAERLERRGFDTYIRPTAAFSTLGWFNDPLLSTLLRFHEVDLVGTVIHELTHNTIYLRGQGAFNESFATFVGDRGAIDFFCALDGPDSPRCLRARDAWDDNLVFGRFLSSVVAQLEALYENDELPLEELLEHRETVFRNARATFADDVRPRLRVAAFRSFAEGPLNNASIMARRIYYKRLDLFDAVFERFGGDLPATIRAIVAAAEAQNNDPFAAVERLLER